MMWTTKNLVRSLLSGLLLMGASVAGVPEASATVMFTMSPTAQGGAEIGASLTIVPKAGIGEVGFTDDSFIFGSTKGSGVIDDLGSGASSPSPYMVEVGANSVVSSGPSPGNAFAVAVGIGSLSVGNYTDSAVELDVLGGYEWGIKGYAATPKDFAAAGVALFVVISDYVTTIDWFSDLDTLMTAGLSGVEIIPVFGAFDYTSSSFVYSDTDVFGGTLYLDAYEEVTVSLVAIAGAEANTVPEPASIMLFGSGLVGLVAWRMKKKHTV